MAEPKIKPDSETPVSPFADATRTPIQPKRADVSSAAPVPSPARMLQASLEASMAPRLDGTGTLAGPSRYSPRLVTASVVTVCLAFWLALYMAASALI